MGVPVQDVVVSGEIVLYIRQAQVGLHGPDCCGLLPFYIMTLAVI